MAVAAWDIITFAQAKAYLNIGVAAADTAQDVWLQEVISDISAEIELYCKRKFAVQQIAGEIYDGDGWQVNGSRIYSNYYPITAIGPYTSGTLAETTGTITRTTGSFLADGWEVGMTGTIVDAGANNGVTFTVTVVVALTLTVSQTLTAVTPAIASVLNASTATKLLSVADRTDPDTAWAAIETDIDHIFTNPLWDYIELYDEIFNGGVQNIKLTYRAGYSTIPQDLKVVALEMVAMMWKESNRGSGLLGESNRTTSGLGQSYTKSLIDLKPQWVKVLNRYRIPMV